MKSSSLWNVSRETSKIRNYCYILAIFLLCQGCGEDSINEDITAFNKIIESNKEIKSAREVMIMYYNFLYSETDGKYTITEEELPRNRFMVVLIRDDIGDDSMQGEKFVMIVKHEESKWKVVTINRNWKCYPRRGHTSWGTEPCG